MAISVNSAANSAHTPSRNTVAIPVSSTAPRRACVATGIRSISGMTTMPPSASATTPRSATGVPVAIVAARSSPPKMRSSVADDGSRNTRTARGRRSRSAAIHCCAPADESRRTIPPMRCAATASTHNAAADRARAAPTSSVAGDTGAAVPITPRRRWP